MAVVPVFGKATASASRSAARHLHPHPFKAKLEAVYTKHLKKMAEELGLSMLRADELFSPRPFMEKVWDGICAAQLIVADCKESNPNVFYEIGNPRGS